MMNFDGGKSARIFVSTGESNIFDRIKFYNKVAEDQEKRRNKYQKGMGKIINYTSGEKVLLKNRELPSSLEGITKKLLLLYTGPYIVSKDTVSYTHLDVYKRQQ